MKKYNSLGNIMFWLTILSPIVSFSLASIIGEVEIFGTAGIIRYSWIIWLFIPLCILSFIVGKKLKQYKQKYKKNFIVAFICLPLLIIFGSYRFLFTNISYDTNNIYMIENKINLELPTEIKIATETFDSYSVSYLKITNESEKNSFEQKIANNELWKIQLNSNIKTLLPIDVQYEITNFNYFVFYNLTNDEYNLYPSNGKYECIFIAYDRESCRMIVVDELKIDIN